MAGYGMHDGSAIINAVSQYAQYSERQKDKAYNRGRQEKLDNKKADRQDMADQRSIALFDRQMTEYDNQDAERSRLAQKREDSTAARQGFVETMSDDIDEQEQRDLSSSKRLNGLLGKGSSLEGTGVTATDDGKGRTSFGVMKADGSSVPMTSDPNDNNSTPLKARNEDMPKLQEHAKRSMEIAEQNSVDPKDQAAYVRAGFTADNEGIIKEASNSEFMANLKDQGLLKAMKGKQAMPNIDINRAAAKKKEQAESLANAKEAAGVTGRIAALESAFGPSLKGKSARVTVGDDDVVKVSPTSKVETPEGIQDLESTKDALNSLGDTPPKPRRKLRVLAKLSSPEEQAKAIRAKYEGRRKQAAAIGELYVTGNIDVESMKNFMETGDVRVSKMELEEHNVDLETAKMRNQVAASKMLNDRSKAQVNYAKMTTEKHESDVEFRNDASKYLQSEAKNIADWYNGIMNLKGPKAAGTRGRVKALATGLIGTETFSLEQMKDPKFGVMFNEGLRSFLRSQGKDTDLSAESVLPYINTAAGKFKPIAAQTILKASDASGRSLLEVRNAYNKKQVRFSDAAKEKGLDWNQERQELFDTGFLSEYI